MRLKLKYTRFVFFDESKNEYDVICEDGTRGNNIFNFYKNGNKIGAHKPIGGGVNKTRAKLFLKQKLINHATNINY